MSITLSRSESRVYHHIKDNGSITSLEAIQLYGDTRLASTIFRIKKKGYPIKTEDIITINRYGERRKVVRYSL